uniref:Uncharacterized protein n=1 Tax=Ixodes ricinus TaxID=34613 RepID=V5IC38_IXORI
MQKNRETLVWCLTVTSDFTIISGDSCGRTSFWDGATATLISSSKVHNADVLTLCLSEDEKSVYVAGVDPLVVEFTRIGQSQKWVKSLQRTNHTHDVRALACAKDWIVSGGMDTYLAISSRTSLTKHLSFERSAVQLASASGHLVPNGESHLELWQLGSSGSQEGAPGEALPLSTRPALLAHVRPRQGTRFHCAAVSPDCQWLAGSTADRVLLYRVSLEGDGRAPSFEKVAPLMDELGPARFLLFTEDCSRLLVFSVHGAVQVFQLGMSADVAAHHSGSTGCHHTRLHGLPVLWQVFCDSGQRKQCCCVQLTKLRGCVPVAPKEQSAHCNAICSQVL